MPTPSIQTLINDAQQVLNLDSISAVRSVVAVSLANANTGTPLNPNLTTQQLWNEFYQVVTRSKSDIESIIANQLMKFLYSPPAPGGVGADKQVIFNDGGALAGDPQFLWDKTTNLLTVTGSATISGDLTVDTNTLKVTASTDTVTVGATTTDAKFRVVDANYNGLRIGFLPGTFNYNLYDATVHDFRTASVTPQSLYTFSASSAVWYDGAGGTRMTLNSTGLGIGASPSDKLSVNGGASFSGFGINANPLNPVSTSQRQARFQNTGGDFYFGIESSSAGGFFPGSTAYATCFYNATATPLQFFTNGSLKATIDTSGNLILRSSATPATLATNGELTVNATSNTNLRFSYRGSDGVTRVANLTLA